MATTDMDTVVQKAQDCGLMLENEEKLEDDFDRE